MLVKLQFAKYSNITSLARDVSSQYSIYKSVFLCPDSKTSWLVRISENLNEDYEKEEGAFLIERASFEEFQTNENKEKNNQITKFKKLSNKNFAKEVLETDIENGFENWDNLQCSSYEEALRAISNSFGIIDENGVFIPHEEL